MFFVVWFRFGRFRILRCLIRFITFFNGGFSSVRHGSLRRGTIDSIQVEHPKRGVREPEADRSAYAKIFAEVLVEFLETHYAFDLTAS